MDKLSEYIPIIVILVTVIFSIIGKKKKPENDMQETSLPKEIDEEFVDKRELPRMISGAEQKFSEKTTKKTVFGKSEMVKKKEAVPSVFLETANLETEEEKGNSFISFEEEDDVMKAIIYAEIINKKDY